MNGVPYGTYGNATYHAVLKFQQDHELSTVDGAVGAETSTALQRLDADTMPPGCAEHLPPTTDSPAHDDPATGTDPTTSSPTTSSPTTSAASTAPEAAPPDPAVPACQETRDAAAAVAKATTVTEPATRGTGDTDDPATIKLRYSADAHCAWAWIGGSPGSRVWLERVLHTAVGTSDETGPTREIQDGNDSSYGAASPVGGKVLKLRACGQVHQAPVCTDWFDGTATSSDNDSAGGSATTPAAKYVALGDSYSSGEGLYTSMDPTTNTPQDLCHRSTKAYPELLSPKPERFVACSQQETKAFAEPRQSENPQQDALDSSDTLVTMTFGGNDLDWTSTLTNCTKIETEITHELLYSINPQACQRDLDRNAMAEKIKQMKSNLVKVYTQTLQKSGAAQVRVLSYPPLFPDNRSSGGCRMARINLPPFALQLVIASPVEKQFADYEKAANTAVAEAVNQVQAQYPDRIRLVDTVAQFGGYGSDGHTFSCGDTDRPTPWINPVRLSLSNVEQLIHDRSDPSKRSRDIFNTYSASFHPTEEGQRQMALALKASL